jgi:hypothetical protein
MRKYALLFFLAGLKRNSASWKEYERGKTILAGLPPEKYEEGTRALAAYLNL